MDKSNKMIERQAPLWGDGFAWEVVEALSLGVTVLGADLQFEYVNPAYARMVGRPPEELVGLSLFTKAEEPADSRLEVIHPDDLPDIADGFRHLQTADNGPAFESEYRMRHADGSWRWVHSHNAVFKRGADGRVQQIIATITDVTEHKAVEEELQASEAQLSGIIASAMDAIITIDEAQQIVFFNAAAEQMFGYRAAEVVGQSLAILLPERFRESHRHRVQAFGRTGVTDRRMDRLDAFWGLRANGQEFSVEASISYVKAGGQKFFTTILRDVSDRIRTEAALRQSEANLNAVFNNTLQAFILFDRDQRVLARNSVADNWVRQMLGRPLEIGLGPNELFGQFQMETFHESFDQALRGEPVTRQLEVVTPGGVFWFEISHNPVVSEEEGVVGVSMSVLNIADRKQAERALLENEQRFRALIEHAPDAIVILSSHGRIKYASPATGRILGFSREEILDGEPAEFTHAADLPGLQATLINLMRTPGETVTTQYRMRHKDGSYRWLESNISNFYHIPGIKGLVFNFRDVTESRQTQANLSRSEARYRAIVEDQTEMIIRTQVDGTILFVNEAYSRAFGGTPETFVGRNFLQTIDEEIRWELLEKFSRLTPERPVEVEEYQTLLPDGRTIWTYWTGRGIFDEEGRLQEVQATGYDITERREAEEKLRQSEAQLQHILNTVPEGVLLLDGDGYVRLTNLVAEQYLAILQPEREGGRLTGLGDRPLSELLSSAAGDLWQDIVVDEHAFEATARLVENDSDNLGWVLVLRDVTEERNIQQRVQRQDRLAAVGQLAAGIAHDFNNIMAVIILYAELILWKETLPPNVQDRLHTIENQARRATDLIQQILDFSRQSVLERQLLDLLPFMKELVKLFGRTLPEHIQIELQHNGEEFLIHADLSRIQQVLMNLAVNARDAMPNGGRLRLSLGHVHTEKPMPLSIRDMPPGDWIQIQIADSGSGISPEALPQIFEPFFTTKEVGHGTGLGLAQVYGIIQQHEGHIDVQTRTGRGTTFSLYFPALLPKGKAATSLKEVSWQQGQGQTLLIVEDDPSTREALVNSLAFLNYKIVEAANGREALAILETEANRIDLVLSDVVMPEMGGIVLLHTMRKNGLTMPVVLMTGHPQSEDMENLQELGLAGWLPKPPGLVNLAHILTQVLVGEGDGLR